MVDIFDEVEEELRAERAQKLLMRYSGAIIGGALIIVAAVAGWQGLKWYQARQDQLTAVQYIAAMNLADAAPGGNNEANRPAAIAAFGQLAATGPEGYRTLARLREAALRADSGDLNGATTLWDQVAGDGSADPLLRDLASLTWATRVLDHGDPAVLEARLKALSAPDNPWHALAEEQLALLDLRQNQPDAAKTMLRQLAQDATAPSGVRGRASGLLSRLGG